MRPHVIEKPQSMRDDCSAFLPFSHWIRKVIGPQWSPKLDGPGKTSYPMAGVVEGKMDYPEIWYRSKTTVAASFCQISSFSPSRKKKPHGSILAPRIDRKFLSQRLVAHAQIFAPWPGLHGPDQAPNQAPNQACPRHSHWRPRANQTYATGSFRAKVAPCPHPVPWSNSQLCSKMQIFYHCLMTLILWFALISKRFELHM